LRATLAEEFRHALATHAEKVAIKSDNAELTYADLDAWSRAVCRQLHDVGLRAGDVVALYLRNRAEFVVCDVAISRLGAVKLPINYMLPTETVAYILDRASAKAVVVDAAMAGGLPSPTEASGLAVFQVADAGADLLPHARRLADLTDASDEGFPVVPDLPPTAPAAIYFTGGTTGRPKGVLHTQASTVALHYAQLLEAEIRQDDCLLLLTPLAHAAGLFAQSAVIRGATIVLHDGFDAGTALDLFASQDITWTFLVPTMIYRILDLPAPENRLALRTIVYGAAPIAPSRLEQALDRFGRVFIQLYGQTECPNWGTRLAKEDHDPARPDLLLTCGQASIMADVKVVDDDGKDVALDEIGEICLKSPYLLHSYLLDPAATEQKFLDGWIRTGDIGTMDARGYLTLKDRKADMVITGGMNVYCREVEDVLAQHPDVRAVAVIGIPHEDWGEAVHAVVTVRSDAFDPAALIAWSRDRLARYAVPKSVEVVESLPETAFGKVEKKKIREPHWQGRDRGIA
jgi:fatty-acyl-CoA synthase/long-chain acyl-CoA synthetase